MCKSRSRTCKTSFRAIPYRNALQERARIFQDLARFLQVTSCNDILQKILQYNNKILQGSSKSLAFCKTFCNLASTSYCLCPLSCLASGSSASWRPRTFPTLYMRSIDFFVGVLWYWLQLGIMVEHDHNSFDNSINNYSWNWVIHDLVY